ncbi:cell wall hydrolase [Paenibacillus sp. S3N08]|uniref:Cell wall hydrolase n=2 Tax=Paenibacillus agricola TaxID=2716264 RepID=A0ABX0JD79_9BACL|nr:cell wall hydrolase [Paenibacillus agricola]NHN31871.1 cell wall hydrolase [Paenibacillus agricola]
MNTGSQSEHVQDLQERLATLGYFKVGVTGYYGSVTEESIRKFQKDNKLPVDGEADEDTIAKLMQKTKPKQAAKPQEDTKSSANSKPKTNSKPSTKNTQSTLEQLARIIYSEARGESFEGQVAVGSVVMNRVQSSEFPDSISEVIFQPGQFTAIDDGQYWLTPNKSAYAAAQEALKGTDKTKGALYYYNPELATSTWSKARATIKKIGNHVFTY